MRDTSSINSGLYWDARFAENWETCEGPRQSRFFAQIAIDKLPRWLIEQMKRQSLTLADWGCAQGDGTDVWAGYIDAANIVGVDFSSVAIKKATQCYPAIRFVSDDWLAQDNEIGEAFDVVFSSNTLEHFHKPYDVLRAICVRAKKAVILALPYRELERIDEHFFSFLPQNIPLVLGNGFRLIWSRVVDCRVLPNTLWGGDQIILTYVAPDWLDSLRLTLNDCQVEQFDAETERDCLRRSLIDRDARNTALNQAAITRDDQIANLGQALGERDVQITSLNQILSERQEQITVLNQTLAERHRQITSLNQVAAERDAHVASLRQIVAERDEHVAALSHEVWNRDQWLVEYAQQVSALKSSSSWQLTAPFRWVSSVYLRATQPARADGAVDLAGASANEQPATGLALWRRRMTYMSTRYRNGVQRYGLLRSMPLAARASRTLLSAWLGKRFRSRAYEQKLRLLRKVITEHRGFIDLFHVPMGWSTPLFQRFQHMSLQAAQLGGLALYGGHLQVDTDIFVFKRAEGNVIVFDALDDKVVQCVFDALQQVKHPKILRLQSIDLATRVEDVERFLNQGLTVVYEYIDEISEEITGSIPDFVIARHKWLLKEQRVLVVATSDKLFNEVRKHRDTECTLSTNGVDVAHWAQHVRRPPVDMEAALASGRTIVGYHGALANWIDYELLRAIADDGSYELVLIGYEHDPSLGKSGIIGHPNVHFLGSKSYFILNEYAAYYDIGILPFKNYALTESVSPVKLFEYMAAGKPVVTTDLRECTKYESCLVSDSHELFLQNLYIASAARNDETYKAALRQDAEANSWVEKSASVLRLAGVEFASVQPKAESSIELPSNRLGHEEGMNSKLYQFLRRTYWQLPLSESAKEAIVGRARALSRSAVRSITKPGIPAVNKEAVLHSYVTQILSLPSKSVEHVEIASNSYVRREGDPKLLAYYLPQFHPTAENDEWWGRGVTEWNNVSRAVPQYVGHYQPRLPGELGFYDLRVEENVRRQIELAKMYGVYGFSFYYYWFDGVRLLDKPLNTFFECKDMEFPFSLCWANESWTRRFDGSCGEILIKQSEDVESYVAFIDSVVPYMRDARYIRVKGRPVLTVYRPSFVPDCANTLAKWRRHCLAAGVGDPYIIGVKEHTSDADILSMGFDAQSEFHPGTVFKHCTDISSEIDFVRDDFGGAVFDYRDIVENQKYFRYNHPKLHRAVMPMWDNTARRDNRGMIFEGSSPGLYKRWLSDVLLETKAREDLAESFVFINAWNEWGEGAYLEPDKKYGYAYLEATRQAIEETRG